MSEKQNRILIFGAGVIGSAYAIKFLEAGIDVTMFARSDRFKTLKEKGLRYSEKGTQNNIHFKNVSKSHTKGWRCD